MRAIVTQRESIGAHGEPADSLERKYVDFLHDAGYEVYPISSFSTDVAAFVDVVKPDLIVLTGGGIVQKGVYRYNVSGWYQDERDRMEDTLLEIAFKRGIPVLGICRGMHKLNAYFGGSISSSDGLKKSRKAGKKHPVEIADGIRFKVNHFHKDSILPEDLGQGVQAMAVDPANGTIEAFCHEEQKVFGVQWHPERIVEGKPAREWVLEQLAHFGKVAN